MTASDAFASHVCERESACACACVCHPGQRRVPGGCYSAGRRDVVGVPFDLASQKPKAKKKSQTIFWTSAMALHRAHSAPYMNLNALFSLSILLLSSSFLILSIHLRCPPPPPPPRRHNPFPSTGTAHTSRSSLPSLSASTPPRPPTRPTRPRRRSDRRRPRRTRAHHRREAGLPSTGPVLSNLSAPEATPALHRRCYRGRAAAGARGSPGSRATSNP